MEKNFLLRDGGAKERIVKQHPTVSNSTSITTFKIVLITIESFIWLSFLRKENGVAENGKKIIHDKSMKTELGRKRRFIILLVSPLLFSQMVYLHVSPLTFCS